MADTLLDTNKNPPADEIREDNPTADGANVDKELSVKEDGELDEKTKQGFQRLVAKKDQTLQEITSKLEEANQRLLAFEAAENEKKMAEMTETERLKAERDDYATKFAKAELKSFVTAELTRRNLMTTPLAEDIIESPWLLRAVKSHLTAQPTWEQTIEAVKSYLPAYLDTLIVPVGKTTPNGEPEPTEETVTSEPMPSERGEPTATPSSKRVWTKQEIAEIQKDSAKWLKYRADITLAYSEGRVVQ